MPNIIIAYDHLDKDIGANCQQCYLHLDEEINLSEHNVQILSGEDCSSQKVQEAITALREQAFIFIAYSHGNSYTLVSTIEPNGYVTPQNAYFFGSSLIYTNSCYTALYLKDALLESNCLAYVGYEDIVLLPHNSDDECIFIACENKGIIHFLTTNDTLYQSVEVMKLHFQEEYDKLVYSDFILASRLLINQQSLVIGGNSNLTKNDFVIISQ